MENRDPKTERNQPLPSRYLEQRRQNLVRSVVIILVTTAVLLLLLHWYLKIPQGMDCARMAQHIANALEDYRTKNHKLPATLEMLSLRPGRYGPSHYEYWFKGLGGPENLPNGTFIAYCKNPHRPIFSEPWRNVLLIYDNKIVITHFSETQFQALLEKQRPAEFYFGFQQQYENHYILRNTDDY
jgi:hypothetical protein